MSDEPTRSRLHHVLADRPSGFLGARLRTRLCGILIRSISMSSEFSCSKCNETNNTLRERFCVGMVPILEDEKFAFDWTSRESLDVERRLELCCGLRGAELIGLKLAHLQQ
jgi:hypothetical protein